MNEKNKIFYRKVFEVLKTGLTVPMQLLPLISIAVKLD